MNATATIQRPTAPTGRKVTNEGTNWIQYEDHKTVAGVSLEVTIVHRTGEDAQISMAICPVAGGAVKRPRKGTKALAALEAREAWQGPVERERCIIMAQNNDGTSWAVGLGGWVPGVEYPTLHDAVEAMSGNPAEVKRVKRIKAIQDAKRELENQLRDLNGELIGFGIEVGRYEPQPYPAV